MALVFTEQIDPTALATVVLAVATLGTVVLTMRSLRYTKNALGQTREGLDLSRREVEEAHRPVLVPIVDATQRLRPDRPESPPIGPHPISQGVLWVPIENIGSGPALAIEVSLELPGGHVTAVGDEDITGAIAGLGADHRLPVEVRVAGLTAVTDFSITIVYQDVAGKSWRTAATYVAAHRRYADISVTGAPEP